MKTFTFDLETTGLPPKNSNYKVDFMDFPRILEVGYKVDGTPAESFLINQGGILIPPEATAINKITDEMVNASPFQIEKVLPNILNMGNPEIIIGFNIYFDTSIIKANILRLIAEGKLTQEVYDKFDDFLHKERRIDVMRKAIKFAGVGAYPKLSVVYRKLFNEDFNGHSAKDDCEAVYRCYLALKDLGHI